MNNSSTNMLNYRVSGKGYPVVFLHGFLESSTMWKGFELENCFCIYIDLPGHGNSKSIDDDESMTSMASKVLDVLEKNEIQQCTLVGHSMGGYVSLELFKKTSICDRLILLNSNFWADDEAKRHDRDRVSRIVMRKKASFIYEAIPNLFHDPTLFDQEVKALITEAMLMQPEAIAICSQAMKFRNDNAEIVLTDSDKITIIQGVHDPVVGRRKMQKLLNVSNVDYQEVDSGHMAHIEAASEVIDILGKKITETN